MTNETKQLIKNLKNLIKILENNKIGIGTKVYIKELYRDHELDIYASRTIKTEVLDIRSRKGTVFLKTKKSLFDLELNKEVFLTKKECDLSVKKEMKQHIETSIKDNKKRIKKYINSIKNTEKRNELLKQLKARGV